MVLFRSVKMYCHSSCSFRLGGALRRKVASARTPSTWSAVMHRACNLRFSSDEDPI